MFDIYMANKLRQQGTTDRAQQMEAQPEAPPPLGRVDPPPGMAMAPPTQQLNPQAPPQSIWDKLRERVISERNLNFGDPNAPWVADEGRSRSVGVDPYTPPPGTNAAPAAVQGNAMIDRAATGDQAWVDWLKNSGWAK
jgi:hypothetical protein